MISDCVQSALPGIYKSAVYLCTQFCNDLHEGSQVLTVIVNAKTKTDLTEVSAMLIRIGIHVVFHEIAGVRHLPLPAK
jgi:hypothetical protein